MSRTKRQPYRKSRAFDSSCRSHGSCGWCYGNRMHRVHREIARAMRSLRDWLDGAA